VAISVAKKLLADVRKIVQDAKDKAGRPVFYQPGDGAESQSGGQARQQPLNTPLALTRSSLFSLVLFQEAARREEVTGGYGRELAVFLESEPLGSP
jgi:hypothetical protein